MGDFGFEAVSVLLVLLPGFFAARVVQALCVRPSQTEFDKLIEALLYSFLVYVAFSVLFERSPLRFIEVTGTAGERIFTPDIGSRELLSILGIALVLSLLIGFSITNDLHGRILRRLHVTQRTTRSSVWSDIFHDVDYYVQIQFTDGRKIRGWPRHYSDTPEEASIFLEKAAWITSDGKLIEIPGPGILITKNLPIETIMFLTGRRPS
ncbi:MAG: DUF6338 family protein [Acidobacteriales bacterium]|nr:DUF6338 family protein [Terriglobales bacterium]MCI0540053.1 DUF6338 family protein [Verrucomicrobiales bacterium]